MPRTDRYLPAAPTHRAIRLVPSIRFRRRPRVSQQDGAAAGRTMLTPRAAAARFVPGG